MAKKLVVLAVVLPLLGAGAYFGGEYLLARSAAVALEQIKANLPQGATLAHGKLSTNLLRREVVLDGFEVNAPVAGTPRSLSAAHLRLAGLPWLNKGAFELGELSIEGLRIERQDIITAEQWTIKRPGVQILSQLTTGQRSPSEFSFLSSEATNFSIKRAAHNLQATVAKVTSGALANGRLARIELQDVKASSQDTTGPLVRLSVEKLVGEDIDVSRVIAEDGNIDLTGPFLTNGINGLEVTNLSLGPDAGEPITLASLVVKGEGLPDGTRTALSLKAEKMVMPLDAMPSEPREYYGSLGYERMTFTLEAAGRYEPAAQTLSLNQFNLVALDAGTVNIKFTFGGLTNLNGMMRDSGAAQLLLATLALNSFELKVTDAGFVKRHVAHGARKMQVVPEVYVEQMINAIRPVAGGGGQGEQKLAQLYRAVSSFLLNPGELTINAKPERPVPFLQLIFSLNSPSAAAENLNISATNRQLEQSSPAP